MAKTAAQSAAKWAANLSGATQAITDGVNSVTVAPGMAAARQQDVWASNTAASKSKWAANVQKVSLGDWQTSMTTKGIGRIASGATAAQPKMEAFLNKLLPYQQAQKAQLPPRGNLQQNIQRMTAWATAMSKFSNS